MLSNTKFINFKFLNTIDTLPDVFLVFSRRREENGRVNFPVGSSGQTLTAGSPSNAGGATLPQCPLPGGAAGAAGADNRTPRLAATVVVLVGWEGRV